MKIFTKRVRGRKVTDLYLTYLMKFISPSIDLTKCILEQKKILWEKMCNERETEDETKLSCGKPLRSATQS